MSTIEKNTAQLRATASQFNGLRDRISHLGSDLDAALRPARRSDVPELGQIDGTYWPLRSRISNSATTMDIQARDLRQYAEQSDLAERLNMWLLGTSNVPYVTMGPNTASPKMDWFDLGVTAGETPAWELLGKLTDVVPKNGVTAAIKALNHSLPLLETLYGVVSWKDADRRERFGIGLGFGATAVSRAAAFDALLANVSGRAASAGLASAARAGPQAVVAYTGWQTGWQIGTTYTDWLDYNRARGVSNVDAIMRQDIPLGTAGGVKAAELGLLALNVTAEKAGQAVFNRWYGVEESKPEVLLESHKIAVVLAGWQDVYGPNVRIVPGDGKYTILIPSSGEIALHQFTFDNETGKRLQ